MIDLYYFTSCCNPCSSEQTVPTSGADVAEESMKAAVERVKESPHHATSGEVRVPHFKKSLFLFLLYN